MHYYRFPLKDYRSAAGHLFLRHDEDLTFRRLIDEYLYTEKPLTNDIPALARRIGMDQETVKFVLREFFVERDDANDSPCWWLKWADEEIERAKEVTKQAKERAYKRWKPSAPSN